jgi:spore coat polysaccharide biosynthesis predicted glycosyltransferase SpsG
MAGKLKTTGMYSYAPDRPIRLLLRIDANHRVGFGHAVRSSALVATLRLVTELVVAGDDLHALASFFPSARLRSVERDNLTAILDSEQPDAVLVDLPRHTPNMWSVLRGNGRPVIAVDDEGGAVTADLVINGTVLDDYHLYPALSSRGRALVGSAYTLLRPAFGTTPWRNPDRRSVAVVVGSGERAWRWAFALMGHGLDRSNWGEVSFVVGASCAEIETLRQASDRAGVRLISGLDAPALANLLARSRVALITGGMILYEALAVGVPAVVFPQIPNLIPEAAWFAARGAIRDLGFEGGMDMALVGTAVRNLLRDRAEAGTQSTRARALVDGRGLDRAARVVEALLTGVNR